MQIPENRRSDEGLLQQAMQRNRGKQQNGKSRYLFKKRNISSKDGHDKGRNVKDITEAEEIKKKWQEHTEEIGKKGLNDPDNHNGVSLTQSQTSWNVKSSGP